MGAIFCWGKKAAAGDRGGVKTPPYGGNRYMGGNGKVEGRACPALRGGTKMGCGREGQGGGSPPPLQWAGGYPKMGSNAQPVGTLQASKLGQPP